MKHYAPKAYYRGRVVSHGLNCILAENHAEALRLAAKYFSDSPVYDRVTVRAAKCDGSNCLPWPPPLAWTQATVGCHLSDQNKEFYIGTCTTFPGLDPGVYRLTHGYKTVGEYQTLAEAQSAAAEIAANRKAIA